MFDSYDTESLNNPAIENVDISILNPEHLQNTFQATDHKKINIGIQKLYIIGRGKNCNY